MDVIVFHIKSWFQILQLAKMIRMAKANKDRNVMNGHIEKRSENTYKKLLEKKKKGIKFTENERKWFHKLDKWAKIRNGSPLWERNKHGEVVRAKYELICSHTARRSGTTNLYKLGVLSDLELRSITGHESQKNFEGYIRIGISEQALRVGDKIKAAMEAKKQVDK